MANQNVIIKQLCGEYGQWLNVQTDGAGLEVWGTCYSQRSYLVKNGYEFHLIQVGDGFTIEDALAGRGMKREDYAIWEIAHGGLIAHDLATEDVAS